MLRAMLIAAIALVASACASMQKMDAAGDVHALLVAIRDDDRASFDALVDRPALQLEIERRIRAEARTDARWGAAAAVLAPGLAKMAGDLFVQPGVFRAVAEHYGYTRQTQIPPPLYIAQTLKPLPDGRVCATGKKKDAPCLLVFSHAPDGRWKLSGFEGDLSLLRIGR